jgi:hypothetical protein
MGFVGALAKDKVTVKLWPFQPLVDNLSRSRVRAKYRDDKQDTHCMCAMLHLHF